MTNSLRAGVSKMKPDFILRFFSVEVRIFFLHLNTCLSSLTAVIKALHVSVVHNIYLGTLLWVCIS